MLIMKACWNMQMNPDVHAEPARGGAADASGAMYCAPPGDVENVDSTGAGEGVSSPTKQVQFLRMIVDQIKLTTMSNMFTMDDICVVIGRLCSNSSDC